MVKEIIKYFADIKRYLCKNKIQELYRQISTFPITAIPKKTDTKSAVIVMPWLNTDVPWYSIVIAIFWRQSGEIVDLIIDDMPFACNANGLILSFIKLIANKLSNRFEVINLKNYTSYSKINKDDEIIITNACKLNSIWQTKGESDIKVRREYELLIRPQMVEIFKAIDSLVSAKKYDCILIPGGIYGSTSLWVDRANWYGSRIASFDSGGKERLLFAANGIASQLQDIPKAYRLLITKVKSKEEDDFIKNKVFEELEKRKKGKDRFSSQLIATNEKLMNNGKNILVAMNSSWDSAALGLHTIFDSNTEWLKETIKWISVNTDYNMVIRQHPAERFKEGRSSDNYKLIINNEFGNTDRIVFIGANDPINTYDLILNTDLVIVYASTLGVEASVLGKPVIVPSSCYYADLGFVLNPQNISEYFEMIKKVTSTSYIFNGACSQMAIYCYYITQCCNWISTPFSPESYDVWSKYNINTLYSLESVQLILKSLTNNVPISYLNHKFD